MEQKKKSINTHSSKLTVQKIFIQFNRKRLNSLDFEINFTIFE